MCYHYGPYGVNYLFRIHGVNLFEYFTYHDCLTEPCAAACLQQVTSALCYLHQLNIAHLSIKVSLVLTYENVSNCVTSVLNPTFPLAPYYFYV